METAGIEPNKLYTVKELAAIVRVHERTVWRWLWAGKFPTRRMGRKHLILGSDVIPMLEARTMGQTSTPAEPEDPVPDDDHDVQAKTRSSPKKGKGSSGGGIRVREQVKRTGEFTNWVEVYNMK